LKNLHRPWNTPPGIHTAAMIRRLNPDIAIELLRISSIGLKYNELFIAQVEMPEGRFNNDACQGAINIDVASFYEVLSLVDPKGSSNEIKFRACISQATSF
jgi:hypothetical protein